LCEGVEITVRYESPRDFGLSEPETRREFNIRFGQSPGPEPEIPDVVSHVWNWFWVVNNRRQYSPNGPQPLTFSEIDSWVRRMDLDARPEEIEMLVAMDDAFITASYRELRDDRARQQSRQQGKN
jgi:hypothetical protein